MTLIRDQHIDPNSKMVQQHFGISVSPAQSLTNAVLWLKKAPYDMKLLGADLYTRAYTAAAALRLYKADADSIIIGGTLAIDAVPEKFKLVTKTIVSLIDGKVVIKAPATAIVFTLAHTVNVAAAAGTAHWGCILVQMSNAGVVSTKVISADQDYATEALAIAARPAPDAAKLEIGYITIQVKTGGRAWTANTDDMTAASDVTGATFYSTADSTTTMTASIAPVALDEVEGVVEGSEISEGQYIVLLGTTDGTMVLTDARLTLRHRAMGYRGRG